jgi:hypothetical protein
VNDTQEHQCQDNTNADKNSFKHDVLLIVTALFFPPSIVNPINCAVDVMIWGEKQLFKKRYFVQFQLSAQGRGIREEKMFFVFVTKLIRCA